jgi:signal peptidase I
VELGFALAVAALWAVTLRPTSLGGPATYVVIRGDSMLPVFHSGDLVVLRNAEGLTAGDVVGYRVPDGEVGAGYLVVHRIASGDAKAGYTMLGDNNPAPDPWQPRAADVAGKAWVLLPGLGRVIVLVHEPAVAAALAVSVLVTFVLSRSRWPARDRRPRPAFSSKAVVGTSGAGQASPSRPG